MGQGVLEALLIPVGAKEKQQLPPAPGAGGGKSFSPHLEVLRQREVLSSPVLVFILPFV